MLRGQGACDNLKSLRVQAFDIEHQCFIAADVRKRHGTRILEKQPWATVRKLYAQQVCELIPANGLRSGGAGRQPKSQKAKNISALIFPAPL